MGVIVVDVDETKLLGIALGPLKVVEQRPGRVSDHITAIVDC